MKTNEKETIKTEIPFVLKCSATRNEIADTVNHAHENGIPYTVICEILLNISNQANALATQEQELAKALYQKQIDDTNKKEG